MYQKKGGNGGKRKGAGRLEGSKNTLGYGEVRAIKVAKLRVPDNAPLEVVELADRAQQRIIDIMEGAVHHTQAGFVLKAAVHLREETCGPVAQKVQHQGADGGALTVKVVSLADEEETLPTS